MTIYKTATYLVRSDNLDLCKAEIQQYVSDIKATEPGTVVYVSLQDQVNTHRFFHFFAFENREAEDFHRNSPATKRFTEFLIPELVGPVSFGDYEVIAET